jgi:hypothetical protein
MDHVRELEVEYVVLIDFHPKQHSMEFDHVSHMVFDRHKMSLLYLVQRQVVMDLKIIFIF